MSDDSNSSDGMDWDRVREHYSLSPKELEVTQLIFGGRSGKQIARELVCSVHTIDTHRRRMYRKVGVRRRDQLIVKIMRVGHHLD